MVLNATLRIEQALLITCSDKAQLNQTARHRGGTKHQESSLMNSFVRTAGLCADFLLDHLRQLHALGHVLVLYELKHDVTLRGVRVEALIALLIVFLHQNHGVLTLCHIQILSGTVHTQRIYFKAAGNLSFGQGVGMHTDKEVGLGLVGNIGTFIQRDKDIGLAGIDDFHVRTVALHHSAESQSHLQVDVLLLRHTA